MIAAYFFVT